MNTIIDDMKIMIYDINSIAPRHNAFISKKLGLNFLDMSRKDFITYNFMKLDKNNYISSSTSNIVIFPNNENNDEDKNIFYKFYYEKFNNKMKELTKFISNIISQQNNKTIRQCNLSKILNLGNILDEKHNFTFNITQLMNESKMIKRIKKDRQSFIELSNELEYIPQPYIDNIKLYASQYEAHIASYLDKNNIEYIYQYKFKDCKDKRYLPFDFLIKYNNSEILLEYDGKQHEYPVSKFGGEKAFIICKKHDEIKNRYSKNNEIPLLRINKIKKQDIDNEINQFLSKFL